MTDGDSVTMNTLCNSADGTFVTLDDYLPNTDAGLSPDVDMGLILNEAGVRCLLNIQAADTIGGDSKRDRGVAHEEDESLDHWPLVAWDDLTGRHLIRK